MKEYVLDANALLRYFGTADAEGGDKVESLFMLAKRGDARLLMSVINLGEFYYVMAKRLGEPATREHIKALQHSMTMVDADQAAVVQAASLRHGYKVGYADSFAAALALGRKATLVSADPGFEKFGKSLKWIKLPAYVANSRKHLATTELAKTNAAPGRILSPHELTII